MQFSLEVWFSQSQRELIAVTLEAILPRHSLSLSRTLMRHDSAVMTLAPGMEQAQVRLREFTEQHHVLDISFEHPSRRVLEALLGLWEECFDADHMRLTEAILAWDHDQLNPLLTHSQWRDEPLATLVSVDPQTLEATTVHPGQPSYWEAVGPRLHFVRSALITTYKGPGRAASWAAQMGAGLLAYRDGVIFDCGWSARWPGQLPSDLPSA